MSPAKQNDILIRRLEKGFVNLVMEIRKFFSRRKPLIIGILTKFVALMKKKLKFLEILNWNLAELENDTLLIGCFIFLKKI